MVNTVPLVDAEGIEGSLADLIDGGVDLPAGAPDELLAPTADILSLDLSDLLPDAAGEVVLMGGADIPLSIHAGEAVTASGIADAHVTAGGLDVTGLNFYSFENGVTLYSPIDLVFDGPHGAG